MGLSQFSNEAKDVAIMIDPKGLVASMEDLLKKYQHQLDYIEGIALPASRQLKIDYEDFNASPIQTMNRIVTFLGLNPDPGAVQSYYQKSTPDAFCQALKNYEEIKLFFQEYEKGKYFEFFDPEEEMKCRKVN